jgi:hypothetical protein
MKNNRAFFATAAASGAFGGPILAVGKMNGQQLA